MKKLRTIQIRLSKDDYERIKNDSRLKGFCSMSGFLRHCALDHDFVLAQKISEIHSHLLGNLKKEKYKKNPAV